MVWGQVMYWTVSPQWLLSIRSNRSVFWIWSARECYLAGVFCCSACPMEHLPYGDQIPPEPAGFLQGLKDLMHCRVGQAKEADNTCMQWKEFDSGTRIHPCLLLDFRASQGLQSKENPYVMRYLHVWDSANFSLTQSVNP